MVNESSTGMSSKRKRDSDEPMSPTASDDASSSSCSPAGSDSTTNTVSESPRLSEGVAEADGLVHVRTDAAKAAWTKKMAIMQKKWHAKSYEHFFGEFKVTVNRPFTDNGTSNFIRYFKKCKPKSDSDEPRLEQTSLIPFVQGSMYTYGRLHMKQVEWAALCHHPYHMFEDRPYHDILRMMHADVKIPSADTVSRDVKDVYNIVKKRVAKLLQNAWGRIHIAQDGWAAPQKLSLLGLVAVWVIDGKLQVLTLDMIELHKSHTGVYLADVLCTSLREFGILDKLLSVPGDNASTNTKLLQVIKAPGRLPRSHIAGPETQVRCAGHIFDLANKVAKRGNEDSLLDDEADNPDWLDDDDDDELDKEEHALLEECTTSEKEAQDDADLDELLDTLDNLQQLEYEDGTFGRNAVMKIFKLGRRIFNNGAMQEDLSEKCKEVGIAIQKMIRAVVTHWLTHGTVLRHALILRPALDMLCDMPDWNKNRKKAISCFKLTRLEWQFIEQLRPMLMMLSVASERISSSGVPLLHEVIPLFDLLISKFEDIIIDTDLFPGVRAATIHGHAVLCKYYSKTDDSYMYRMSMIMHPAHKMSYFRNQKWEPEWIDRCYAIVHEIWNEHYKPSLVTRAPMTQASSESFDDIFPELSKRRRLNDDVDALEKYLSEPVIDDLDDPLHYWTSLLDECDSLGKVIQVTLKGALAQMALDFLSAPATSTDVERLFSHGGLNMMKHRHNLSAESTIDQTVLNSWTKCPGLLPEDEITQFFNDKSKRPNNSGARAKAVDGPSSSTAREVIQVDTDSID
ncbi:uncharacterized protein ARMOST_19597 [Armillaria ostoyae]|uniref:HAT C-terminal dimerisation domain-containing protein n=1 Tax=Armillaria ostoyae TaxID=47428 RepID=A0A284S4Z2_ARMOS|nr:uncharacterized protein ARMOST_19597 [Armillaria ostoyae]